MVLGDQVLLDVSVHLGLVRGHQDSGLRLPPLGFRGPAESHGLLSAP